MERNELIQERKRLTENKQQLQKRLEQLNLRYEQTDDDDKYGCAIQATEDELTDVQDELDYINEELRLDTKLKKEGFLL